MMMAKRLLLGSAAALVGVTGAQAADLGLPVAPAVDYVQICTVGGFTGFLLPGSDVCFDISGFARWQTDFAAGRVDDEVDMYGVMELNFDARTMTDFGLLRGFVRLEGTAGTGVNNGIVSGGAASALALTRAFVQFGGLTAGFADSFFDPVFTGTAVGPYGGLAGDTPIALIGYTASFGNGFTAGLAFEDGEARQQDPTQYDESQTIPDIVANIRIDQAWGSAKLAAALHEIDPVAALVGSEFGYAIGGSADFNLPFGHTSTFGLVGAYTRGALAYIGEDNAIGGAALPALDYVVNGTSANLTTAWMVGAGFEYGFTPTLDLEVDAFYVSIDHDEAPAAVAQRDGNQWAVSGSLAYTPVAGLEIRGGVSYQAYDYDSTSDVALTPVDGDEIAGRIRITRSF